MPLIVSWESDADEGQVKEFCVDATNVELPFKVEKVGVEIDNQTFDNSFVVAELATKVSIIPHHFFLSVTPPANLSPFFDSDSEKALAEMFARRADGILRDIGRFPGGAAGNLAMFSTVVETMYNVIDELGERTSVALLRTPTTNLAGVTDVLSVLLPSSPALVGQQNLVRAGEIQLEGTRSNKAVALIAAFAGARTRSNVFASTVQSLPRTGSKMDRTVSLAYSVGDVVTSVFDHLQYAVAKYMQNCIRFAALVIAIRSRPDRNRYAEAMRKVQTEQHIEAQTLSTLLFLSLLA